MANGKICINCYCIIPNASLQCYNCGELQLAFYVKAERNTKGKIENDRLIENGLHE